MCDSDYNFLLSLINKCIQNQWIKIIDQTRRECQRQAQAQPSSFEDTRISIHSLDRSIGMFVCIVQLLVPRYLCIKKSTLSDLDDSLPIRDIPEEFDVCLAQRDFVAAVNCVEEGHYMFL